MSGRFSRDLNVAHVALWIADQGKALEPQRAEAESFLNCLEKRDACFSFRTFSDSTYTRFRSQDPLEKALHGSLDSCWEELVNLNKRGAVVTVTINRTNCIGRKISDITQVRALFLDDDIGGDPDRFNIPPHMRVETSPNHYHYYWRVDGLGLRQFQACQQRLSKIYQGDSRVQALNQSMQLPGFWRRKQMTVPRLPRVIEVSEHRPLSYLEIDALLANHGGF